MPSFLGYQGYPATICASVNSQVVHAIPSADQVLHDGDLISIDCGAVLDGWHGDAAITVAVGPGQARRCAELAAAAEDALWAGIADGGPGRPGPARGGSPTSPGRWRPRSARRAASASSTATAATASAPRCTRTRTCSTTAGPAAGPRLVPGLVPRHRADDHAWARPGRSSSPTAGPWSPRTARSPPTSSTRWRCCADGAWVLTAEDGGRVPPRRPRLRSRPRV